MPSGYADFHLIITRDSAQHAAGYSTRVTTSPAGQATAQFSLDFTQDEVQRLPWQIGFSPRQIALVPSAANTSAADTSAPDGRARP